MKLECRSHWSAHLVCSQLCAHNVCNPQICWHLASHCSNTSWDLQVSAKYLATRCSNTSWDLQVSAKYHATHCSNISWDLQVSAKYWQDVRQSTADSQSAKGLVKSTTMLMSRARKQCAGDPGLPRLDTLNMVGWRRQWQTTAQCNVIGMPAETSMANAHQMREEGWCQHATVDSSALSSALPINMVATRPSNAFSFYCYLVSEQLMTQLAPDFDNSVRGQAHDSVPTEGQSVAA